MIGEWEVRRYPSIARPYKLTHGVAFITLGGPCGQISDDRVLFYSEHRPLSGKAGDLIRETFPRCEIVSGGNYISFPIADFAMIKLAAS